MKIIDMSHVMNVHTPGWVGYAGNKMYYAQNLQTQMIVAQRIDTALHVGTHFDGAMHATDNRKGDMASLPLDYLVNRGVVVDIPSKMSDWAVITPEIIESAGADIREGDILILHTGWHQHYEGQPQQDLVKYFCYHPGPNLDTLHWMLKKKIKWWGMDTGSCDHAMNTSIRTMRPDLADPVHQAARARRRASSSAPSNTPTRSPAGAWSRTCSRSTIGRFRKGCCTPRISAATSSSCSTSAR